MTTIPTASSMRELYIKNMEVLSTKELTDTIQLITSAAKNAKSSVETSSLCEKNLEQLKEAGYSIKISVDQEIGMETYIISW